MILFCENSLVLGVIFAKELSEKVQYLQNQAIKNGLREAILLMCIERFSIECRKTKTRVITLANHKGHRQSSEPIKTRSNYM